MKIVIEKKETYSKNIAFRLPEKTLNAIRKVAKLNKCTLSNVVRHIVEKELFVEKKD